MVDLEPCPFCGGKNVNIWEDAGFNPQGVVCHYCKIAVKFLRIKPPSGHEPYERVINDIAERWNRREGQDG